MQANTKSIGKPSGHLSVLALLALLLIKAYQYTLSPLLHTLCGPQSGCRFHPSCSHYAHQCYQKHPFLKASYYTMKRILACNPRHPGGHDPIP